MKKFSEYREETERMLQKLSVENEKLFKSAREVNIAVSGIGMSNGAAAEETIYNALERDMTFGGITFDDIDRNINRKSKKHNVQCEFDVLLENGDTLAIIETKYRVRKDDVSKLVTSTLDKFRKLHPLYSNYKIMLGIGGMSFEDDAIDEANANGVGIIQIVGDKVECQTNKIKIY